MTDDRDLRPDHEMDGRVSTWLTDTDLTPVEANAGLDRLLDEFPVTPQARRRYLGRWLDRDEGVGRHAADHDPPPNTNRRTRLMLSATGLTAALAILAISVNVIESDPIVPGQATATHVVAADGSGDFTTIQAAVDAAAPGDTVSVRPGRYMGPISIDRDLTISGDGPPEEVVIVAPPGEADLNDWIDEADRPHALLAEGADVTITDITVEVPLNSTGIGSIDGSPLIERVTLVNDGPEVPDHDWYNTYQAFWFHGVGEPVVRDSAWVGYAGVRGGAAALFEGNNVSSDGLSVDGPGATIVRGNTFVDGGWLNASGAKLTVEGNDFAGGSVSADSQSVLEVRENVFRDYQPDMAVGDAAITVYEAGSHATIEANTITAALKGIQLNDGATGSIVGNTIEAWQVSIQLDDGSGTAVEDNTITGTGQGVMVGRGSDATIAGNDIDVDARGISILNGSTPTVSGNEVCGGSDSIWIADGAEPVLSDNQVC